MRRLHARPRGHGGLALTALALALMAALAPQPAASAERTTLAAPTVRCGPAPGKVLLSRRPPAAAALRVSAVAVRFRNAVDARLNAVVTDRTPSASPMVVVLRYRRAGLRTWQARRVVVPGGRKTRVVSFRLARLIAGATYQVRLYAAQGATRSAETAGRFTTPPLSTLRTPAAARRAGPPSSRPLPLVVVEQAAVGPTTARLQARVNPRGAATAVWFEYGATARLGGATAVRTLRAARRPTRVQAEITGLKPDRTYAFRVFTRNRGRTTGGALCTVTTAPPGALEPAGGGTTPPGGPGSTTPPAAGGGGGSGGAPTPPRTADYYVAPNGSDSADGSAARPWRTLNRALQAPAGSTVGVRAGTYAPLIVNRSGQAGRPITLFALEAGVTIAATASQPNAVEVQGAHDVHLFGFTITGGRSTNNAGVKILDGSTRIEIADSVIRGNRNFGIDVNGSTSIGIRRNEITGNDVGIRVNRSGAGVVIEDNLVHHNTGMIVNDSAPGNDTGAVGVSFLHTAGPVVARRNTIWGNRAPSNDYGYDGSGFEIYGASGLTMVENVIWDNQTVLETGTSGERCAGNVFARNIAYGGNDKSVVSVRGAQVNGIHIRCAEQMLIANNVFHDLDYWVYDINVTSGFSGRIDGFRILNNIHYQVGHKVYAVTTPLPSDAVIDNNVSFTSGARLADVTGRGAAWTIEDFRSFTGQEGSGVMADPQFTNAAARDYSVGPGSPAIDRGRQIPGITDGFLGAAPDAGRFERQ